MKQLSCSIVLLFLLILSCFNSNYAQYHYNKAASFNGTSSYIVIPNDPELNPTSAITLEAWIYPRTYGQQGYGTIIGKSWYYSYWFGFNSNGFLRFYPAGTASRFDGITPIPLNKWTHVAATYDGSNITLYVNGVLDNSSSAITTPIVPNTDSLMIGCDRDGNTANYHFNGMIDNVRIWRVARTQQQIFENRFIPFQIWSPSGPFTGLAATYNLDWDADDWSGNVYNTGNFRNITLVKQYPNNYVDYNNTLVLDGASYIACPNDVDYNATTGITLEAWVLYDASGEQPFAKNVVNKSGGTDRYDYALFLRDGGKMAMEVNGGGAFWINTDADIPVGEWTHIAGTYKASTGNMKLFVNGELVKETNFPAAVISNNPDSVCIGGIAASIHSGNKFKGQIDEVKIWKDSVRTPAQIKENMFRSRDWSNEFDYVSFNFSDYNRAFCMNMGLRAAMKFNGNPSFSSPNLQNDLYSTSPVLSDTSSKFQSYYNFSNNKLDIPDNGFLIDSILVSSTNIFNNVNVFVLINHINVSDLRLKLISPTGMLVELLPSTGSYTGNDIMTIFKMTADSLIKMDGTGINAPFSHTIKPANSLFAYAGESISGWWKLKVQDVAIGNKGYLNGWGLKFDGVVPVELTTFTGTTQGNDAQLNWLTVTETNNLGFTVERKIADVKKVEQTWQKIDFVQGKVNCTDVTKYSYLDKNLQKGKYVYRLAQMDMDGKINYSKEVEVEIGVPDKFALEQNYPNPFNPVTKIKFSLPQSTNVTIKVFDILGKEVATLLNTKKEAGKHELEFNASAFNSGIYFYRIEAGEFIVTKKMTLLK